MDSRAVARHQRAVLVTLVVAVPVLFWSSADGFGVPKWTLLVAGALALLVLLVRSYVLAGQWRIYARGGLVAVGSVVAATLVVTVTSDSPVVSLVGSYSFHQGWSTFLALAILAVTVLSLQEEPAEAILAGMAVAAGIVALITAGQLLGMTPVEFESQGFGKVPATLGNPNFGAAYLGLSLPALLFHVLTPSLPSLVRQVSGVFVLVVIIEVGVIGSAQGPITALVAAGAFAGLWAIQRHGPRRTLLGLVGIALPAAVAVAVFWEQIWNELATSARVGRYGAWVSAWRMFRDNPIAGVGLDRYENFYPAYQPAYSAVHEQFINAGQAHNVILDLMADGGIILGGAYLAMVVYTGFRAVRGLRGAFVSEHQKRYVVLSAVVAVWLAYQVQSLVSIDQPALAMVHWVSMAVILRMSATQEGLPAAVLKSPAKSSTMGQAATVLVSVITLVGLWFALIPLRADLAAGEARRLLNAGRPADAEQELAHATSLMGFRAEYWIQRGLAAQAALGASQAVPFIHRGAELSEGNSQVALMLAQYFDSAGNQDQAARWFEEALERDPRNPTILEAAAQFYADVGDSGRAERLRERREQLINASGG